MWEKYGEFSDHKADLTYITVRGKEGVLGRKNLGQLCSNTKSSTGWMRKFLIQDLSGENAISHRNDFILSLLPCSHWLEAASKTWISV